MISADFPVPNSHNKARSPENFSFKSFFPWETSATKFFQCEIFFSSVYRFRFPIEFQLQQFPGKKGFIFLRIFGWCIYMFLNHQNRSNAFTEFSFLQDFDLSKLPIDSYRASPCDSGFSAILLLHYGWIEVEGGGVWKLLGWSGKHTLGEDGSPKFNVAGTCKVTSFPIRKANLLVPAIFRGVCC